MNFLPHLELKFTGGFGTARAATLAERKGTASMLRNLSLVIAAAAVLASLTANASAAPAHAKRHAIRHWHGYGFLPGYRPPERVAWERARAWARTHGPVYWYGGPRFYRGRWNGGGFGPCWTQTPIGPMWNCGR